MNLDCSITFGGVVSNQSTAVDDDSRVVLCGQIVVTSPVVDACKYGLRCRCWLASTLVVQTDLHTGHTAVTLYLLAR